RPVPRALWLRLGATLLGAGAVLALGRVPAIGIAEIPDAMALPGLAPHPLGLLAVGVTPFITSYALVELVALLVPSLRRRRVAGRAARAPLRLAADLLGIALAMVQAWVAAQQL